MFKESYCHLVVTLFPLRSYTTDVATPDWHLTGLTLKQPIFFQTLTRWSRISVQASCFADYGRLIANTGYAV